MTTDTYRALLQFLEQLEHRKIHYTLDHIRPPSVLVSVVVPGERWEVEFMEDGSIEVERFVTTAQLGGREQLDQLLERFTD